MLALHVCQRLVRTLLHTVPQGLSLTEVRPSCNLAYRDLAFLVTVTGEKRGWGILGGLFIASTWNVASTRSSLARTCHAVSATYKGVGNVGEQMEYLGGMTLSASVDKQGDHFQSKQWLSTRGGFGPLTNI